eukprot:TRINITY_DN39825_c0_g1_i1.p1 TRINITY_DN39825_c0_g1~~TRINITY_DN39825_c0_g1_i1.p1  ORF type:complete len:188 (+),score=31.87 TRINITY_DN39825_c0_g1_i1:104-667(+)
MSSLAAAVAQKQPRLGAEQSADAEERTAAHQFKFKEVDGRMKCQAALYASRNSEDSSHWGSEFSLGSLGSLPSAQTIQDKSSITMDSLPDLGASLSLDSLPGISVVDINCELNGQQGCRLSDIDEGETKDINESETTLCGRSQLQQSRPQLPLGKDEGTPDVVTPPATVEDAVSSAPKCSDENAASN